MVNKGAGRIGWDIVWDLVEPVPVLLIDLHALSTYSNNCFSLKHQEAFNGLAFDWDSHLPQHVLHDDVLAKQAIVTAHDGG